MSGASSTLVDGMDWGPGGVVEGTAEAHDAKIALINAVLTQDGAGAANEGESEASRLWRCGTLRSTSPSAMPLLKLAVKHADERYVLCELHWRKHYRCASPAWPTPSGATRCVLLRCCCAGVLLRC